MVEIVENLAAWYTHFQENFVAHLHETGDTNFKLYEYARNQEAVSSTGIDIRDKRLLFVTSSGAYLPGAQEAFDAPNPLGDYRVYTLSLATPVADLAFAHDHYDHQYVDADPQTCVPLNHLKEMVANGEIGEIAPEIVSFSGYMPDLKRVVEEVIPDVLRIAKEQQVQAALLAPV